MTEKNNNLLLDEGSQPSNGIQKDHACNWFGGPISVSFNGVFGGATVELMFAIKFADSGLAADIPDADWISLDSKTAPGVFSQANLNPCILATKVSSSGVTTRVRVTLDAG